MFDLTEPSGQCVVFETLDMFLNLFSLTHTISTACLTRSRVDSPDVKTGERISRLLSFGGPVATSV